jgi:hypothetical protein
VDEYDGGKSPSSTTSQMRGKEYVEQVTFMVLEKVSYGVIE